MMVRLVATPYRALFHRSLVSAIAILLCSGVLAVGHSARAQSLDPAVIHQQQLDAINQGDVAGALAVTADGVVFIGGGTCFPAACIGKAAVQGEFQSEVGSHIHLTRVAYQVSGNTVTGTFEVTSDATRMVGIDRAVGPFIAIVANGQVVLTVAELDPTDPQTAMLLGARQSR